jgi:hypothetical protein
VVDYGKRVSKAVIRPNHDGFEFNGTGSVRCGHDRRDVQRIEADFLGPALAGRGHCGEHQHEGRRNAPEAFHNFH